MSYHISHQDAGFHDERFKDPIQSAYNNRRINDMNDYISYTSQVGDHQNQRNNIRQTRRGAPNDYRGNPLIPSNDAYTNRKSTYYRNPIQSSYANVTQGDDGEYQRIDTPYNEVQQTQYQQTFNKDTKTHSNQEKRVYGNRSIMDYHIFSPKYEQHNYQTELMFGGIGESLRENRKQAEIDFSNEYDVKKEINRFNDTIDNLGVGVDIRKPLSTRDQVKDFYNPPTKSQNHRNPYIKDEDYSDGGYTKKQTQKVKMATNRYLENYQFDDSRHINISDDDISNFKSKKKFDFNTTSPLDGNDETWMF